MPPKNKFTKEQVVEAAVCVVRKNGIDGLTAKTLAGELGTSTQPIFSYFDTMNPLKKEVQKSAERLYDKYSADGLKESVPFFGLGMQYIRFAKNEPELYRLLFLSRSADENWGATAVMNRSQVAARPSLMSIYKISAEKADRYFRDLWLVVHSLATLIVTECCPYSEGEIAQILTGFSVAVCKAIKEIPDFVSGAFDRDEVFKGIIGE